MSLEPAQKRDVRAATGVSIGGTPLAYVAMMAAVVAVLAFIPAAIVVGGMAATWPLHDVIHPLVGLLLGPIAGPIASAVGILVGNAIAPYTNLGPWSPIMGAMSAFAVGMVAQRRSGWWLVPWVITVVFHLIYLYLSLRFGISFWMWLANVFTVDVALILIAVPQIRNWALDRIHSGSLNWRTAAGLFVLFFFGSTAGIQALWVPNFLTAPWPAEVWGVLIPIILIERVAFTVVGVLVAMGVISALRRSSFIKPAMAGF
jgi:hypothetical protein